MKNLKLELFNYKKGLSIDQEEIATIIQQHLDILNTHSELYIIKSLNEKLKPYTYDKSVKMLIENLNTDLKNYELLYELKHLYTVLSSKNQGLLYRQPLNVLLQIINLDSDEDRMSKILNELVIYDWIPEIKLFILKLTESPEQRTNIMSGGKVESVYTVVEQVKDGYIAYIKDSWFLLTDDYIEKTLLENNIEDERKLTSLRMLETAIQYAIIYDDKIEFKISENLTIGLSVAKKGVIFINGEELDADTSLENLFSSPIVPIVNKNFYPLLLEVSNNLDKFVELDVVKKVTNIVKPHLEIYAFNYKNNIYLYRCDGRYGYSFFKYESALELVNDVKSELNCDLTYFYEDKLNKEIVIKKKLEDKEKQITLKLEDIKFNIDKIESSIKTLGESKVLKVALNNLNKRKKYLEQELMTIKELQYREKTKL